MRVNVRWTYASVSLALCCAVLLQPACDGCQDQPGASGGAKPVASVAAVPRLPIALRLSESERSAASALVTKIRRGRFPRNVLEDQANANLFLFLAAASDQPRVIEAALDGMRAAFGPAPGKPARRVTDDYGVVIAAHLQSDKPRVQLAAVLAAPAALAGDKPSRAALDELAAVVVSCPVSATRVEAVVVLGKMPGFAKNEAAVGAMLRALEADSPAVVSRALRSANEAPARDLLRRDEFLVKARALIAHRDATVRGRAAHLALVLSPTDNALWDQVAALLTDVQGCVRTEAAAGLAKAGQLRAIHRLVPLAGDSANARCETPFRLADGRNEAFAVNRKGSVVAEYVVPAIVTLSQAAGVPLAVPAPGPGAKDANARRQATASAVRAWYEANQAKLPRDVPPTVEAPAASAKPATRPPAKK